MNAKQKVLIVDDTPEALALLSGLLKEEGYSVFVCDSGELALATIENINPHLVLLDIVMPGINGFEVCKKIKSNSCLSDIPVIFLTAANDTADRITGLKLGAVDYINKPFEKDELLIKVRTHLNLYSYHKLFREQTAEQLIENDKRVTEQNNNLLKLNAELELKNAEIQKLNDELKKSNQQLTVEKEKAIQNEIKFRTIVETSTVAIYLTDINGKCIYTNPLWQKHAGLTKDEALNDGWINGIHPEDRNIVFENWSRQIESDGNWGFEYRFKSNKDGEIYWVWGTAKKISDVDDNLIGFVGINVDITERKSAELELISTKVKAEESKEQFATSFYTSPISLSILSIPDGLVLSVNEACCELYGYSREELIGKHVDNLVLWNNEDDKNLAAEQLTKIGKLKLFETKIRTKENQVRTILLSVETINWEGNKCFITSSLDITDRKQFEISLTGALDNLKLTLEASKAGTWDWNIINNEFIWSEEFLKVYHLPSDTNAGFETWQKCLHPDDVDLASNRINEAIESKKDLNSDYRIIVENNEIRWIKAVGRTYYNGHIPERMMGLCLDITDQKLSESMLLESERKYSSLFQNMIGGYAYCQMIFDGDVAKDWLYIDVNSAFEDLTGLKDAKGKLVTELIPGIDLQDYDLFEIYKTVCLTGNPEKFEYYLKSLNKWFFVAVFSPQPQYFVAVFDVITERKKIEYELIEAKEKVEESENRLKLALSSDLLGVWDWNVEDNVMVWDDRMFELYGVTRDSIPNNIDAWLNGLHPEDKQRAMEECNAALKGEADYNTTFRVLHPDGKVLILKANALVITDNQGKAIRMIGINGDITETVKAQRAVLESEKKFFTIFNSCPEPIALIRMDTNFYEDVNEAFYNVTGYNKEELIGHSARELNIWANIEDRNIYVEELNSKGYLMNFEFPFKMKNNEIRIFLISAVIIEINDIKYTLNFIVDITERKTTEKLLIEAKEKAEESDRLKTAFLQNMSHEIRTPLNGILGFSDLLNQDNLTHQDISNYSAIIKNSGVRLLETIGNIIDISKIETNQIVVNNKNINLNSLILELYKFFNNLSTLKGLKLTYTCGLEDINSDILSDEGKLNQILTNLISNSIKFTESGSIEFGYAVKEQFLEFFITDTGKGISEKFKHQIFSRFSQADISISRGYEGSGLGLSISKGFVELLGGKIWFESDGKSGSTFYFTIPYCPSLSEKVVSSNIQFKTESKKSVKILLAEDDIVSQQYMDKILKLIGYEYIHAENGNIAIELVKSNPEINLILMDIKMPVLNGIEATKIIKEMGREIRIIAQTAYASIQERDFLLQNGFDDYLSKPIQKEELKNVINRFVQN